MSKAFHIRAANPGDIDAIDRLCRQLGYEVERHGLQRRLEQIVDDPEQIVFVAQNMSAEAVGWVHALPVCYLEAEAFIEIGGLVVHNSSRRMGIGQALMEKVEAWTRESGYSTIRLRSNIIRTGAHEFYRSIGYAVVKEQYTFVKELE